MILFPRGEAEPIPSVRPSQLIEGLPSDGPGKNSSKYAKNHPLASAIPEVNGQNKPRKTPVNSFLQNLKNDTT